MNAEVSIVMPVWNGCSRGREDYLRRSIESIQKQTFENWELVIVDDGSTDDTPKILDEYADTDWRIHVFRNKTNLKIVRALNRGISESSAPLIARQDADDYSTVTRLEIQKSFMDARPDTAMCGTGMYVVDHEGKLQMEIEKLCSPSVVRQELLKGCPFVHGSVMFRKEAIESVGLYSVDPRFDYAEDYELWVRFSAAGHILENIPGKYLYFHRNHDSKSSQKYRQQQEKATRLIISMAQSKLR